MFKLTYSDDGFDGSTTSGAGYSNSRVWRANSLYDPDYTGVGVQPYGYDQLTAIYGAYIVLGSKITVNWAITGAATQVKAYVLPTRLPTPTYRDPSDLARMPFCRRAVADKTAGMTRNNWVKNYCSTRRILKIINPKDNQYAQNTSDNPVIQWYWVVVFDTSGVTEEVEITYDVKIRYYAILNRYDSINES